LEQEFGPDPAEGEVPEFVDDEQVESIEGGE
jgi:hypothetical protein